MHVVRIRRLGLPQESREAFRMLQDSGVVDAETAVRLQAMVGFRNIALHNYQKLDLDIVRSILSRRLDDFRRFAAAALKLSDG